MTMKKVKESDISPRLLFRMFLLLEIYIQYHHHWWTAITM